MSFGFNQAFKIALAILAPISKTIISAAMIPHKYVKINGYILHFDTHAMSTISLLKTFCDVLTPDDTERIANLTQGDVVFKGFHEDGHEILYLVSGLEPGKHKPYSSNSSSGSSKSGMITTLPLSIPVTRGEIWDSSKSTGLH